MIRCELLKSIAEAYYYKETGLVSHDYTRVIPVARPKIFDFDYDLFDMTYKGVLETKILKHFYNRRLCTEDYNRWKLFLDSKLNEILPYYNQLYASAALELNPLYNFVIDVQHQDSGGDELQSDVTKNKDESSGTTTQIKESNEKTGSDSTEASGTNHNTNKYNDTPQGRLTEIQNGTYLTEATIDDGSNHSNSEVTYGSKNDRNNKSVTTGMNVVNDVQTKVESVTTDRQYVEQVRGIKGNSDAELLMKFRETFLNIDMLIIEELSELFDGQYHAEDFGERIGWDWYSDRFSRLN